MTNEDAKVVKGFMCPSCKSTDIEWSGVFFNPVSLNVCKVCGEDFAYDHDADESEANSE